MTGFAADFDGLVLFGIKITVAHDIKLCMAVNTGQTRGEVDVLPGLPGPGEQGDAVVIVRGFFIREVEGVVPGKAFMTLEAGGIRSHRRHFMECRVPGPGPWDGRIIPAVQPVRGVSEMTGGASLGTKFAFPAR